MLGRTITKTDGIMAQKESFANTFTMPQGLDSDGNINFMNVAASYSTQSLGRTFWGLLISEYGGAIDMIEFIIRKCCPTFWACCSATKEYVEDSNRHYVDLERLNQEVEVGLCTVAWLMEDWNVRTMAWRELGSHYYERTYASSCMVLTIKIARQSNWLKAILSLW